MVIWTWYSSLVLPHRISLVVFLSSLFFWLKKVQKRSIGIWIWITSSVIIIFIHINFDETGVDCAALTSFNKSLKGFINEVNASICHYFFVFLLCVFFSASSFSRSNFSKHTHTHTMRRYELNFIYLPEYFNFNEEEEKKSNTLDRVNFRFSLNKLNTF